MFKSLNHLLRFSRLQHLKILLRNKATDEKIIFKSHIIMPFKYLHYLLKKKFVRPFRGGHKGLTRGRRDVGNAWLTLQSTLVSN